MERLLVRLARAAESWRWRFAIVWAALLVVALPFAGQVGGALSNGGFDVPGSQSMHLIDGRDAAGLGAQPITLLVVADEPAAAHGRFASALAETRRDFPQIRFRQAPISARGGRVIAVTGFSASARTRPWRSRGG